MYYNHNCRLKEKGIVRIIGITGPTGSGKSYLCRYLCELGIPCIDADEVYHSMLTPPSECLEALRAAFGSEIFTPDGNLDRSRLGAIVFNSPEKLELLNRTVLHRVLLRINDMIADLEAKGHTVVALDAPTLIESGFHKKCNTVISVLADKSVRQSRIMERDELTEEKANLRISAQKSEEFYRENSDYIIKNNGDTEKFKKDIFSILSGIGIKQAKGSKL